MEQYEEKQCVDDEYLEVKKKALSLLRYGDRTEWELREKLKGKGFGDDEIEVAIEYVYAYHYLDDERYAKHYVDCYINSRSVSRIKMDLKKKHIPDEYIIFALESVDYDDSQALERAFKKIMPSGVLVEELGYEEKQKIMAKLARKGFSIDKIRHLLS